MSCGRQGAGSPHSSSWQILGGGAEMGDLGEPGYLQERRGRVASNHLGWQF